jgi:2-keto-4-pentenoate hydratase/2-oxohepta-3-ene-1,7-dioic acid hydratase in catechol pathway
MTKLATFESNTGPHLGVVRDGIIVDLTLAAAELGLAGVTWARSSLALLDAGQAGLDGLAKLLATVDRMDIDTARQRGFVVDETAVKLLPPLPRPPKILCVARNYGKHAAEAGRPLSEIPIIFARFAKTLVAQGDSVVVPKVSEQLDWEGELAVVIGKPGRYITRENAMQHVAGYSIFNDVTVRDYQFRVSQYTSGKNFSQSGPFGPYLVLVDEVADPHTLDIKTRLNGELVQDGNTSEMVFDIPTIIEHLSEWLELEAGDVIPMGTPAGVGFTRQPPRFLRHGDVISVEVEGLGILTNPVIDEKVSA